MRLVSLLSGVERRPAKGASGRSDADGRGPCWSGIRGTRVDRERAGVGAATADDVAAFLTSRPSLVDPPHVLFVSDGLEVVHDRGAAVILIGRVEIAVVGRCPSRQRGRCCATSASTDLPAGEREPSPPLNPTLETDMQYDAFRRQSLASVAPRKSRAENAGESDVLTDPAQPHARLARLGPHYACRLTAAIVGPKRG